jgi:transposase
MAKRYELSDAAWDLVADLFVERRRNSRPRTDDRLTLNGVFWVLCSGAAWRDMPEHFEPWSMVYPQFRD